MRECDEAFMCCGKPMCVLSATQRLAIVVWNAESSSTSVHTTSYACFDPALPLLPPIPPPFSPSQTSSDPAAVPFSDCMSSSADAQRRFCETEGYEGHSSNVLRTMGYFSLIGLLRVHCLLGEYETALKALGPIQPFKTSNLLTPKVAGANIALYYYTGFSYLMLQRYLDAARAFNIILNYINRSV